MYYSMFPSGDEEGNLMALTAPMAVRKKKFHIGKKLSRDTSLQERFQVPLEPVRLTIKPGRENAPLPSFLSQPLPVMSKALLEVLEEAGVSNIDAYKAEIYNSDEQLVSDQYVIANIIGLVAAADLEKSKYDEDQPNKIIAMSFDALSIDAAKAHGFLMFRLAESPTTIVLHESVKEAIEEANIPYLTVAATEDIAVL